MAKLTRKRAEELLRKHTTEEHLFTHAAAVSAAAFKTECFFMKNQSSISSNASRPFLAAALTSPCRTNSIVTNDSATNSAAYGKSTR